MSIEVTPLGVACNLSCPYCYQNPMRDAGNIGNKKAYDIDKMIAALTEEGSDFSIFGGEALLVPLEDLEKLWAFGLSKYGKNGIQTNGVLITPAHIAVFNKYKVHVGFSLDGPDELNDSRWAGSADKTREATAKSHANLAACIKAGVGTSLIITLYRGNALPDKLPRLKQWIQEVDRMGIRGIRVHLLEIDHPMVRQKMQLTTAETISALNELVILEAGLRTKLDILTDMRALLRADDERVTCIWNPCDPYTTSAVRGVDGQGNRSNCGRTNKDGIMRLKAQRVGYERQAALYHTPQEHGGCQGCRFFLMCKGQCPGTALDGDWRNRSDQCPIWMSLFETLEKEMVAKGETPLSLAPERKMVEGVLVELWGTGRHNTLKAIRHGVVNGKITDSTGHADIPHGDDHGDHWDSSPGPHNDIPHGDDHGDHTDEAQA